jgi:hypothetical protein
MTIKFIEDYEFRGHIRKKGTKINVARVIAIQLCREEVAVAEIDIPCEDKAKKKAKDKEKKKKKELSSQTEETDMELDIDNKL